MSDFTNLLFACAHLKQIDKQFEWPILLEALSIRVMNQVGPQNYKLLVQCMLSLTLADVGTAEEFWQPLF